MEVKKQKHMVSRLLKISPGCIYRMEPAASPTYNGQVYKLLCDDGHYYIGSTITELKYRLYHHKKHSLLYPDRKVYNHILTCGWDTVNIGCVEIVKSNSKNALRKRENEYIKESLSDPLCLNINRAHLTKRELLQQHKSYLEANKDKVDAYQVIYRKDNAEKRCEYSRQYAAEHPEEVRATKKEYYEANKTEILEKQKVYVEAHAEQIKERKKQWAAENNEAINESRKRYAEENKEAIQQRGKEYYEANKEAIKEKLKIYREANAETSKEYSKAYRVKKREELVETHLCECGGKYSWTHEARHKESKRHMNHSLNNPL